MTSIKFRIGTKPLGFDCGYVACGLGPGTPWDTVILGHFRGPKGQNLAPKRCLSPLGPLGPQQPYLQIMLPDESTENAPRTVQRQTFHHFGPLRHESTQVLGPKRPPDRWPQHPKSAKIAPFSTMLALVELQQYITMDVFRSCFDSLTRPCLLGPRPRRAQNGAKGAARGQNLGPGCVFEPRGGNHQKWVVAPHNSAFRIT